MFGITHPVKLKETSWAAFSHAMNHCWGHRPLKWPFFVVLYIYKSGNTVDRTISTISPFDSPITMLENIGFDTKLMFLGQLDWKVFIRNLVTLLVGWFQNCYNLIPRARKQSDTKIMFLSQLDQKLWCKTDKINHFGVF